MMRLVWRDGWSQCVPGGMRWEVLGGVQDPPDWVGWACLNQKSRVQHLQHDRLG